MTTILILEDEPPLRDSIQDLLELEGYTVISAGDGLAGVTLAREYRPDLIISDIQMPEMNGYEVLDTIRRDPLIHMTPFIFLTAQVDHDSQRFGMGIGADDYLTKPFIGTELLASVKTRLQRHAVVVTEISQRIEELNLLRRIDQELSQRLNPEWVISIMMDWALRQTGANNAIMGTTEPDKPFIKLRYVSGAWPNRDRQPLVNDTWPLEGIIEQIIRSEGPIRIGDTTQTKEYQPTNPSMQSLLGLPVATSERRLGFILLESKKLDAFKPDDVLFLLQMANRAAMALEQSNLFQMLLHQYEQEVELRETFGRFVSREVAEAIQSGLINPEGEIRVASVMFCDIRSFTAFSETHPPSEVMRVLNEYLPIVVEATRANGGMINKFGGDSVLAIFGAPARLEAHAYSAVKTAMQIRKELNTLNKTRFNERGFILSVGIGINTGEVVAGTVGSKDRQEYTVIGDTVNLTSRVEALNKQFPEHDILITEHTYKALGSRRDLFRFTDLGPITIRGKAAPVQIWAVVDSDAQTRRTTDTLPKTTDFNALPAQKTDEAKSP